MCLFFSSRRRHTRCALVTGVQTCALPISIGAMPKPARFRERLAAINDIMRSPRLDLGDEPREVLLGKRFYGLLAHNPAGKRFVESDRRLGMIQFRSEEHTSELQSLMRISYAVFCLKKKTQ